MYTHFLFESFVKKNGEKKKDTGYAMHCQKSYKKNRNKIKKKMRVQKKKN